jgi:hypothetical protein
MGEIVLCRGREIIGIGYRGDVGKRVAIDAIGERIGITICGLMTECTAVENW